MKALFDSNCRLVGWLDDSGYIFNTDMVWVAFVREGNAWSALSGRWLGPMLNTNCLDQLGMVVAWNPEHVVEGMLPPTAPLPPFVPFPPVPPFPPLLPLPPLPPETPLFGWSPLVWDEWLAQ